MNALSIAQNAKFSITDFFSKSDQIRSFLRIWSHLLEKSLMENIIFCAAKFFALKSGTFTQDMFTIPLKKLKILSGYSIRNKNNSCFFWKIELVEKWKFWFVKVLIRNQVLHTKLLLSVWLTFLYNFFVFTINVPMTYAPLCLINHKADVRSIQ